MFIYGGLTTIVCQFNRCGYGILFIIAGLAWKFLDKIVEMWEKSQDARISRLIDAKLNPEIKKLSESIDDLKEAIWDLKKP
jgi:hypothetical protein